MKPMGRLDRRLMDGSLKLSDPEYQETACQQFNDQAGLQSGPRFLQVGLARSAALWKLLNLSHRKKLRPKTAEGHAMMCALRVWTYLKPGEQWSQQASCVRCSKVISTVEDVSIVTLAIPPWDGKRREIKTAMVSGFFCSACDVKDDEALSAWRRSLSEQGIRVGGSQEGTA